MPAPGPPRMDPGHVENLAAFLREPSGPLHGLVPLAEDIDRLKPYVAPLPPQQLQHLKDV